MKEEFYTPKRWQNWLNKVKDSKFKLTEEDDKNSGAVFIYIMDDVVLACLKVIARCEREVIAPEEAISEIATIRSIVFEENESMGEDADLMLESLKTSLAAVFVSSQRYITGILIAKAPWKSWCRGDGGRTEGEPGRSLRSAQPGRSQSDRRREPSRDW